MWTSSSFCCRQWRVLGVLFSILIDVIYVIFCNFLLIFPALIGLVIAKFRRPSWGPFLFGVFLQGISTFGCISGIIRNPEVWLSIENICSLFGTAFFVPLLFFLTKKRFSHCAAIPPSRYEAQESSMHQFIVDDSTGEIIAEFPIGKPVKEVVLEYDNQFKIKHPVNVEQDISVTDRSVSRRSKGNIIFIFILATLAVSGWFCAAMQINQVHELQSTISEQSSKLADREQLISSLKDVRSQLQKENKERKNQLDIYEGSPSMPNFSLTPSSADTLEERLERMKNSN